MPESPSLRIVFFFVCLLRASFVCLFFVFAPVTTEVIAVRVRHLVTSSRLGTKTKQNKETQKIKKTSTTPPQKKTRKLKRTETKWKRYGYKERNKTKHKPTNQTPKKSRRKCFFLVSVLALMIHRWNTGKIHYSLNSDSQCIPSIVLPKLSWTIYIPKNHRIVLSHSKSSSKLALVLRW